MDNPQIAEMQDRLLSRRAKTLLHHPQGMGNYFTFKTAIDILGLDWNDVAPGGVYNVTGDGYFDMGYMANHIGPSRAALEAFHEASTSENLSIYPPDCLPELKKLVAEKNSVALWGRTSTSWVSKAPRAASATPI